MKKIALTCLLLLFYLPAFAERPFMISSPRAQAMGNTRIAIADSVDTPFFNPAGFADSTSSFTLLRFSASMNADAFELLFGKGSDIAKYSKENDIAKVPSSLLNDLSAFKAAYESTGPLFLSYKGEGYGIAIINTTKGSLAFSGNVAPLATLSLDYDIGIVAGLGVPIRFAKKYSLQLGINFKYVNRIRYEEQGVNFFDSWKLVELLSPDTDFLMGQAIGSDIGMLIKLGKTTIGVVIYDWFGMTFTWKKYKSNFEKVVGFEHDSRVSPRIATGISYAPGTIKGVPGEVISGLKFSFDIQDFLAEEDSFFKMIHFGGEVTFFQTITTRMGFNQGYFTFGLAYTIMETTTIEYTLFQEEWGKMPGQNNATYHTFALSLKL